jgi:flagellar biosynthetic protein FliQ
MIAAQLGQWVVQALELGLLLLLPVLIAAMLTGFASAALQAVTGISDAALSFVPKLLAVGVALFVSGPWMMSRLSAFTLELWRALP